MIFLNVPIEKELKQRLKYYSDEEGITLKKIVEKALISYLSEKSK